MYGYIYIYMGVKVTQSSPILCDLMDYSLPGSSVMGILQARIVKWVAMPSFSGSSQPRDQTQISWIAGRLFTCWDTREALYINDISIKFFLSLAIKTN